MKNIHERNLPSISPDEQILLKNKKVLILGCGGLGGYLTEYMIRLGVGSLTLVDGDCFEYSNFNRQILSNEDTIYKNKALVAKEHALLIKSNIEIRAIDEFFNEENADSILPGHDLVLDALDNVPARLLLEEKCSLYNLTIVHGAIEGWNLQVAIAGPGKNVLHGLYKSKDSEFSKTSLSFTPAICAGIQAAEAVKLLCKNESSLTNRLLIADLRDMDFEILELM